MNKIGIIGAMEEEITIIRDKMSITETRQIGGITFYDGRLYGKNIVLVMSGIGKVNAAACTQMLISEFRVDAVVNTGVAGSLNNELNIGDIVISQDVIQYDMDTTAFGDPLGLIPRMDKVEFEADSSLIDRFKRAADKVLENQNVKLGRVLTGDAFVSSAEKKMFLRNHFAGDCVEMESGAIGHVSFLNKIPFVIIRAISDKADGTAEMNYNEFINIAARNSSMIVEEAIKAF